MASRAAAVPAAAAAIGPTPATVVAVRSALLPSGARSAAPRSTSVRDTEAASSEPSPGVSITVMSASRPLVRYASRCEMPDRSMPRSAGMPPSGANGSVVRVPSVCTTSIRSTVPYWNRVTSRVHSPMSVGATRRPINALTNVDLPDLIRPATASCSGESSRRSTSLTPALVRGATCGNRAVQTVATAADSGPCIARPPTRARALDSARLVVLRPVVHQIVAGLAAQRSDQPDVRLFVVAPAQRRSALTAPRLAAQGRNLVGGDDSAGEAAGTELLILVVLGQVARGRVAIGHHLVEEGVRRGRILHGQHVHQGAADERVRGVVGLGQLAPHHLLRLVGAGDRVVEARRVVPAVDHLIEGRTHEF